MRKLFITLVAAVTLVACDNRPEGDARIITVSIEPLRYFTEQIAGDRFRVKTMVPNGSNPENYEPTTRQIEELAYSDIYIKAGNIGFERTWMKRLEAQAPHAIIINSSEGIERLKNSHGVPDPHTWMSTRNAIVIARNIYRVLSVIDSKDSVYFRQNLTQLITKIEATDTRIRGNLTRDKNTSFLIYHPSLTYYAHEYGLTQLALEQNGHEPDAMTLINTINTARKRGVKTLFVQKEFTHRCTSTAAKSTGSRQVTIHPLSYDWPREMERIAQKLQ